MRSPDRKSLRVPAGLLPAGRHPAGLLPAALLLTGLLLTACGGKTTPANSQVPVRSTGNPLDQIIAERAAESSSAAESTAVSAAADNAAETERAAETESTAAPEPGMPAETDGAAGADTSETAASDPWLQEDYVYERPENMSHDGIDVDLTVLSPTMVYAEVFNMISYAPDYVGKTIRMEGPAVSYTDEEIGKTYHACLIQDATACCATGLEYELPEGTEYPPDGEEITVTGVFDIYKDVDGIEYCRLLDAVMGEEAASAGTAG